MYDTIASRYDQFIKDLETIVNIDSGSHDAAGIEKIVAFFQERFQKIGWMTTNYSFDDGKVPCLEVTNQPLSGNNSGLRSAFYRDIWIRFLSREQWPAGLFRVTDKRAYGPGVCDMKGGLVTMLHIAEILHQTRAADEYRHRHGLQQRRRNWITRFTPLVRRTGDQKPLCFRVRTVAIHRRADLAP